MSYLNSRNQPNIIRSVSYPYRTHGLDMRAARKPRQNRKPLMSFVAVAIVLVIGGVFVGWPHNSTNSKGSVMGAQTKNNEVEAAPAPQPVQAIDFTQMNATINAQIAKYPAMDIGVAVIDLKTGDAVFNGVQSPFVAASTAKLITAIAFLHDVEQSKASLTQQVGSRSAQDALKAMIIESDNAAWNDFNNGVMSHAELAAYASSIGLSDYDPEKNTITPRSVGQLLNSLYTNKLLNKEHTNLLLSYMLEAKEVDYVTNNVPAGTKVYHKPGYLADRVHDAAIVDNGKRPYALVIFSKARKGGYDTQAGSELFKQITLATTQAFNK